VRFERVFEVKAYITLQLLSLPSPDKEDRESSLEKQRMEDIELLHRLGVTYINDLMVENRKVKYV
jgi:hypothetical protein